MINKSALENIFIKGKYGNFVDKKDSELLKISEIKNQIIYQLARFSNSNYDYSQIKIDEYQKFQKSIDKNIYKYVDINNSLSRKKTPMSSNPKDVSRVIKKYIKFLRVR